MKIYIEHIDGEFYDLSYFEGAYTQSILSRPLEFFDSLANPGQYKTTTRDFEIGSRVYFQGVEWTEVMDGSMVSTCDKCGLFGDSRCACMQCSNTIFIPVKNESVSIPDPINHPAHYTSKNGVECIQVTEQFNFARGNAIKYIWRAGEKDPTKEVEDLEKAVWYIQREIKRIKADRND